MPFVTLPGYEGRFYIPDKAPGTPKKWNCPDCHSCQMCSDDRCQVCRPENPGACRCPSPSHTPMPHEES